MSYILDALKKSEQERQRHTPPDIHTMHAAIEPRRKHRTVWPYFLSLALVANAGLLLWWLQPWQSPKITPPAQTTPRTGEHNGNPASPLESPSINILPMEAQRANKPDQLPSKAEDPESKTSLRQEATSSQVAANTSRSDSPPYRETSKPRESEQVQEKSPPKPALKKSVETVPSFAKKIDDTKAALTDNKKKVSPGPREISPSSTSSPGTNREMTIAELMALQPSAGKGPAKPDNAEDLHNRQSEAPFRNRAETVPETMASVKQRDTTAHEPKSSGQVEDTSDEGMQKMHQLPQAVRKDLPNISFSMFVYSEDPAKRLVSYNGKVVREGQEMAPGLSLERITRSGVVLNFRGYRFEKEEF